VPRRCRLLFTTTVARTYLPGVDRTPRAPLHAILRYVTRFADAYSALPQCLLPIALIDQMFALRARYWRMGDRYVEFLPRLRRRFVATFLIFAVVAVATAIALRSIVPLWVPVCALPTTPWRFDTVDAPHCHASFTGVICCAHTAGARTYPRRAHSTRVSAARSIVVPRYTCRSERVVAALPIDRLFAARSLQHAAPPHAQRSARCRSRCVHLHTHRRAGHALLPTFVRFYLLLFYAVCRLLRCGGALRYVVIV